MTRLRRVGRALDRIACAIPLWVDTVVDVVQDALQDALDRLFD